jgi:hypothetical protein
MTLANTKPAICFNAALPWAKRNQPQDRLALSKSTSKIRTTPLIEE